MQLAIIHYHLNSGGVARVVQNHLLALATASPVAVERVLLLHGGRAAGWPQEELVNQLPFDVETVGINGLDYDPPGAQASEDLAQTIESALRASGGTPETTLLHWHNHALGKNVSSPLAVRRLAELGYRTLLQIHDFAEDFRPANYRLLTQALSGNDANQLPKVLYPQAQHIFYATLNRRDFQVLSEAGVDRNRLHLLPNPVFSPSVFPDASRARQLVGSSLGLVTNERLAVFPVRGIRRKNLGEMLLWSAVAEDARFLVTLAPKNPVERASFDRWQKLAAELELPCNFGTQADAALTFAHLLAASDVLITTSVAEGFGMSFLEAWLTGRNLLGRDLPEITGDFQQAGLDLSEMYSELSIPTEWIDRESFASEMTAAVNNTYQAFGVATPTDLQQQLMTLLDAETVDFARLPTKLQREVVRRVGACNHVRRWLLELNPKLELPTHTNEKLIAANAEVVGKHFSFAAIGKQLADVYAKMMNTKPSTKFDTLFHGSAVLDSFLNVNRLHALRVEP